MKNFSDAHFMKFRAFIHDRFGISLSDDKKPVLESRLIKLMEDNNINSYDEYLNILQLDSNRDMLLDFISRITINKTDFFREINHFDFIRNSINSIMEQNPRIYKNGEIRVWSSACSTGQEPYTLAMVLRECLPQTIRIKILGTDIDKNVLKVGETGVYPQIINEEVEPYYLHKYFIKQDDTYEVMDEIKQMVTFRLFNLMEPFPFKNTFDFIFCRNVMIYFDSAVQQRLLDKFYNYLTPGGLLFIGHSESLTGKNHKFQYIQPTIYMR